MKKLLCILFLVCFAMSAALPIYAAELAPQRKLTLSQTTIEQDFELMQSSETNKFDVSNYPPVAGSDPQLLTIAEDFVEKVRYDLYVYIYNPGQFDLLWQNSFRILLSFNGADVLSFSASGVCMSKDKLFGKVKVSIPDVYWSFYKGDVERNVNFYGFSCDYIVPDVKDVQHEEFLLDSSYGANIGASRKHITFTYDGSPSKLISASGGDALTLDLNSTFFRTAEGSATEKYIGYCSIPKEYVDNQLYQFVNAECTYKKYSDIPLFISNFDFIQYPVTVSEKGYPFLFLSAPCEFGASLESDAIVLIQEGVNYDTTILEDDFFVHSGDPAHEPENSTRGETFVFFANSSDQYFASIIDNNLTVSPSYVEEYFRKHNHFNGGKLLDRFSFESKSFNFASLDRMQIVSYSDVNMSDQEFSKKYSVEFVEEVSLIKQALSSAESSNCYLALFQIDTFDSLDTQFNSYAYHFNIFNKGVWSAFSMYISDNFKIADPQMKLRNTSVYSDLSALNLSFKFDAKDYVIPVIVEPVDITIEPQPDNDGGSFIKPIQENGFKSILSVVMLVFGISDIVLVVYLIRRKRKKQGKR